MNNANGQRVTMSMEKLYSVVEKNLKESTKEKTLVQKIRIALHTIALDSTSIDQDEETEMMEIPKKILYAQLARAVDEYIFDTILVKGKAGNSLPAIANYLGLEQETVLHIGSTDIDGGYRGKNQANISKDDRAKRNKIIIDMWEKGMRQTDISKNININACIVNAVIDRHRKKNNI
jgi:hypothetical protein